MTVPAETNKSGPYNCNGATVEFDVTFTVLDEAELQVILTNSSAVETTLTLSTHYTVSGIGTGSVKITTVATYASGNTITIIPKVTQTQLTDLTNFGPYDPDVVETMVDRCVLMIQQLKEAVDRSVKIAASANVADLDTLLSNVAALALLESEIADLAALTAEITALAAITADITAVAAGDIDAALALAQEYAQQVEDTPVSAGGFSALHHAAKAAASAAAAATFNPALYLAKADNLDALADPQTALANIVGDASPRAIASADTLVNDDVARLIVLSGTSYTLAIDPIANLSDGWSVELTSSASGSVTVDADGSELINSATTFIIPPGFNAKIWKNGSSFAAKLWPNGTVDWGYGEYATHASTTSIIPADDTIPQSSEGLEIITAQITPKNVNNTLRVRYNVPVSLSNSGTACASLLRDSGANAIAAVSATVSSGWLHILSGAIDVSAVSLSATTFKLRVGPAATNTMYINGLSSGRVFGGVSRATLSIEELA